MASVRGRAAFLSWRRGVPAVIAVRIGRRFLGRRLRFRSGFGGRMIAMAGLLVLRMILRRRVLAVIRLRGLFLRPAGAERERAYHRERKRRDPPHARHRLLTGQHCHLLIDCNGHGLARSGAEQARSCAPRGGALHQAMRLGIPGSIKTIWSVHRSSSTENQMADITKLTAGLGSAGTMLEMVQRLQHFRHAWSSDAGGAVWSAAC
jgi:hypothetical protein